MSTRKAETAKGAFDDSSSVPGGPPFVLCLYVAGMTPRSARAIANVKEICEEQLSGRYDLQVIDIYQQPELARREQIIALPTLIKKLPPPLRRILGDLSERARVLVGLDLKPKT